MSEYFKDGVLYVACRVCGEMVGLGRMSHPPPTNGYVVSQWVLDKSTEIGERCQFLETMNHYGIVSVGGIVS